MKKNLGVVLALCVVVLLVGAGCSKQEEQTNTGTENTGTELAEPVAPGAEDGSDVAKPVDTGVEVAPDMATTSTDSVVTEEATNTQEEAVQEVKGEKVEKKVETKKAPVKKEVKTEKK